MKTRFTNLTRRDVHMDLWPPRRRVAIAISYYEIYRSIKKEFTRARVEVGKNHRVHMFTTLRRF